MLLLLSPAVRTGFAQIPVEFWEEQIFPEEIIMLLQPGLSTGITEPGIFGYEVGMEILRVDTVSAFPVKVMSESPAVYITSRSSGENLSGQMLRGKIKYDKWSAGFVSENDSGENFADFTAGFLSYQTEGTDVVLGNYSAGFGQGTVLWQGFDWGSYPEQPVYVRKTDFLRGYISTAENRALAGVAVNYKTDRYMFSAGFSDAEFDAAGDDNGITSLQESGYHDSESSRDNKDRLREKLVFGRAKTGFGEYLEIGISGIASRFSPGFAEGDSIREVFDFSGDENSVFGSDFNWKKDDIDFSGEYSQTSEGGQAVVTGARLRRDKVSFSLSYYSFSEDYWNLHSIIPEGNKTGYSGGLTLKPWPGGVVNLLLDYWKRPWRTYYDEMPPEGEKASVSMRQKWGNNSVSMRIRRTSSGVGSDLLDRNQFRLNYEIKAGSVAHRLRFETMNSVTGDEKHWGYLVSAQSNVPYRKMRGHLSFAFFRVPDYDCRIYLYEYDVPGRISVPFYSGNGIAANAVYKWEIGGGITAAVKASWTRYDWRPMDKYERILADYSLYINYSGDIF